MFALKVIWAGLLLAACTENSAGFTHYPVAPIGVKVSDLRSASAPAFHHVYRSSSHAVTFKQNHERSKLSMSAAEKSQDNNASKTPTLLTSISSTFALIALDMTFRKVLKSLSISFPSSLAGCGTLFTFLVALCSIKESLGDKVYGLLSPGAAVLAKWLPVFFVPSLVTLPLAQSLGSPLEVSSIILLSNESTVTCRCVT